MVQKVNSGGVGPLSVMPPASGSDVFAGTRVTVAVRNSTASTILLGQPACLDLVTTTFDVEQKVLNIRVINNAALGVYWGVMVLPLADIAAGAVGLATVSGIAQAIVASSNTSVQTVTAGAPLFVGGHSSTGATAYLNAATPASGYTDNAINIAGRVAPAIILEPATVNSGSAATPTLKWVLFNGMSVIHPAIPKMASVADASAGSAAEINAIRDALRAAGLMKTA